MHQMQRRGQLRWDRESTIAFGKKELVSEEHKIPSKIGEEEMGVLFQAAWCSQ